jgi:hypothetical protein
MSGEELPEATARVQWHNAALVVALTIYGVIGALQVDAFLPMHGVDLLIHEIGHPLFGLFGNFTLMVLGGTLCQLFFPIAFTVYFAVRRQYYAAAVLLFWVGQSCFDVAWYMRDARALALPLVSIGGGDGDVTHDWNYLFDHWGVLAHDLDIARVVAGLGWACLLALCALGLWYSISWGGSPEEQEGAHTPE